MTVATSMGVAAFGHVIDGVCEGPTGKLSALVDPVTDKAYARAAVGSAEDVERACRSSEKAARSWRRTTPARRQELLLAFADALEANAKFFLEVECRSTGKPLRQVRDDEIPQCVDFLRYFAGIARSLPGAAAMEYTEGATSYVRREPIGVIGAIAPWNYPLMMAVWKIAPALATGNTVVLKPAEDTPETAVMLGVLAAQIYPPGVLNVVCGDRDTGAALVSHPVPRMIALTGSTRAGIAVAKAASEDMKLLHLELGGKAPAVVFADADLDAAVAGIIAGAFYNSGQDCTAATRILVEESVAEEFTEKLTGATADLRLGAPESAGCLGPLVSRAHRDRVAEMVERRSPNTNVRIGGGKPAGPGFFYLPTVISGVSQNDELVQEEVFGPVVTVQTFSTESEAVELANGTKYALASSVWTSDHGTAMRMTAELDFGCVWVGAHGLLTAEMPHGGFGSSGYGKDLSEFALAEYTRVKHVMHVTGV
ncbi:aminobutyraldehyde dehydrogenase [Rhodococcus erythropolis]|uniref:aminobutyraldehyde dehydrogenase n=1 Tax=Rhodococcus erythropolis TaxID=1833 RepID=UPI001BEAAB61|nr:aminobutyraldehyde dehydrogenase [Rhodococcus erythropolis]MBT2264163.1 aminobutyraldehyde dehydrogenase [Rhodococcus erythropolis]